MAVLKSSDEQTTKMYIQLLNQLEEMMIQAGEQDSDDEGSDESGLIQSLVEDAAERGMDEDAVERIFKLVAIMRRKARES